MYLRAKANASMKEDSELVGLKWANIGDVHAALDDPDKEEAVRRLLISDVVHESETHYMKNFFDAFFTPEFRGRLYMRHPQG